MSIASEITRLQSAKANIKTSIEGKGVTVPSSATLDEYSGYIDDIQGTPVINPLSVTENGTYTAPSGVDGYSPVTVNVSGGGGGQEDEIITRKISGTYVNNRVSAVGASALAGCLITGASFAEALEIGGWAFQNCSVLQSVSFPKAKTIGTAGFYGCSSLVSIPSTFFPSLSGISNVAFVACRNLATVNFPHVETINSAAFSGCGNLSEAIFPKVQTVSNSAFLSCSSLASVSFPEATLIYGNAFSACFKLSEATFDNVSKFSGTNIFGKCYNLTKLNLGRVSSVPTLLSSNIFYSTPIGGYSASAGQYGSIYVPASLYEAFKSATNWQYFSNRMVSV